MDVAIRFARVKEAGSVHHILMEAFGPYAGKIKPPFQVLQSTPEGIASGMRRRRHRYAVAVVEGTPVGTLRLTPARCPRGDDYWLVSRLAVLPEFQGHHIARRLIVWLHDRALRYDVPELPRPRAHRAAQAAAFLPALGLSRDRASVRAGIPQVHHRHRPAHRVMRAGDRADRPSNFLQVLAAPSPNHSLLPVCESPGRKKAHEYRRGRLGEIVSRPPGGGRGPLAGGAGRSRGPAGPQRRRQDDDVLHDRRA